MDRLDARPKRGEAGRSDGTKRWANGPGSFMLAFGRVQTERGRRVIEMRGARGVGCVLSWLLWLSSAAHADVVGGAPDSCPPGGEPSTCHAGPHCRFVACNSDADCTASRTCQVLSLCRDSVICAGMVEPDADLEQYRVQTVTGRCDDGRSCSSGTCEQVSACAEPAATATTKEGDGSGCAVAHGQSTSGGAFTSVWLLCGLGLVARRRHRTR